MAIAWDKHMLEDSYRGRYGVYPISDTGAHTGVWSKVVFVEASALSTFTVNGTACDGLAPGVGVEIKGNITSIKLGSGSCLAYVAKENQ